jgi:glycosyltransferase involved in cell wall biosynthesis
MNILMVCSGAYPDEIGGAHTYVYELARHLAALGHRLTILTRRSTPALPSEEMIDGVRYVRYEYHDTNDPVRWRYRLYRGAGKAFESLLQTQRFDIIHAHWPHPAAGVFDHPAADRALRVYTLHAPFFEEEQIEAAVLRAEQPLTFRGMLKRMWVPLSLFEKRRTERRVLRRCSLVFVLSRFMKSRALDYFNVPRHKLKVVAGGVDTRRFCPTDQRETIRKKLGIDAEKKMLLTVRRLVPRMGLKNLVEAMKIVKQRAPEATLLIGGTGILHNDLEKQIRELTLTDTVRLAGFIPSDDLADHYRAADYFIMPTEYLEGFGLATIEAMACGTPALGTPVGGTGEILADVDRGLLFSGTSPSDIADGILRHLCSKAPADLRARVARYTQLIYGWTTVARCIEEVMLEGLRRKEVEQR